MRKRCSFVERLALVLLLATSALAQTTVTGTLKDQNGTILWGGTVTATFDGSADSNVNGQPFNKTPAPVPVASDGTFSIVVMGNDKIIPVGSHWYFKGCQLASTSQLCNTVILSITGSAMDITSQITFPPVTVAPGQIPKAYFNTQVVNPSEGSLYWDLNQKLPFAFSNAVWFPLGGSGGPGGTGWGSVVPNPFSTIQAAINAGGPVIVLPGSTDSTPYSNSSNVKVQNYKQNTFGADSGFFRDVSEWGPVDGAIVNYCNSTAGSNVLNCSVQGRAFTPGPVSAGGDVGKLIVLNNLGPGTYGQISGTMSVLSTAGVTSPGPPNGYAAVTFTDTTDGCTTIHTMPYAHVHLNATGMPTGNLDFQNFYGKGCTAVPTKGTVTGVTGTVTFTGGQLAGGDFVSVITGVNSGAQITTADNATVAGQGVGYFGSDIHDTFQAACNAVGTGFLTNGTLTFSGIGLTSKGIDCNAAGLHILGRGPHGYASLLVYAGKTPNNLMLPGSKGRVTGGPQSAPVIPNAYILNIADGGGARIERLHLYGNSQAMPYGLLISFEGGGPNCMNGSTSPPTDCFTSPNPGASGTFINQMSEIDEMTFGTFWGDAMQDTFTPRLQSCLFNGAFGGNGDFWTADHINCYGADVGIDGVFDQATNWHFGTIAFQQSNIGFAAFGAYTEVHDIYTERNRMDFIQGSPYWGAAGANYLHIISYGGESSAMETDATLAAGWASAFSLSIDLFGLGGAQSVYGRPDGVSSDFSSFGSGSIYLGGYPRGQINIPVSCEGGAGSSGGLTIDIAAWQSQINYVGSGCGPLFSTFAAGSWLRIRNPYGSINSVMNLLTTGATAQTLLTSGIKPLMLEQNRSQVHIGSLHVQSPAWAPPGVAGYGFNQGQGGTAGTTTYNYDVTCTDSLGNEISVQPINSVTSALHFTVTNGNATLSNTNYNYISVWPREGCPQYNLYGDNGIGGTIGYLTSMSVEDMPTIQTLSAPNLAFYDTGKWTKTTKTAPASSSSGSIVADGTISTGSGSTACGTATGCIGFTGGSTAAPGAANQGSMRYDLASNSFKCTANAGAETSCGGGGPGSTTRTWRFPFQGVCQGGAASLPVIFDTTNAPSYLACPAGSLDGEFQVAANTGTNIWYLRITVPPGVVNTSYALTMQYRGGATTGSVSVAPSWACYADGQQPTLASLGTFTALSPIVLAPPTTAGNKITSVTSSLTMTCASGNVLFVKLNPTTTTGGFAINFAYFGIDVTGSQ